MTNKTNAKTPVITPELYLWGPVRAAISEHLVPLSKAKHGDLIGINMEFRGGHFILQPKPISLAIVAEESGQDGVDGFHYDSYYQLADQGLRQWHISL